MTGETGGFGTGGSRSWARSRPHDRSPAFFIGVDGGGTGCRALVTDGAGVEMGMAEGPAALVRAADPAAAAEAIAPTVLQAMDVAGGRLPAAALWAGLAGAGQAGARAAVEIALRSMNLAREVRVGRDVEGAHRDAFGTGPGVAAASRS